MRKSLVLAATLGIIVAALVLPLQKAPATGIIPQVRAAIAADRFTRGEALLTEYERRHGDTPESLEALSWLGRGALAKHDLDRAEKYASDTYDRSMAALKNRPLDAEPHLPIALGAAIEVQAQAAGERGDRSGAVGFLSDQLARFRSTSIATRIQKNINLLTLEGKPVPQLTATEFLGSKLPTLQGRPTLLFFWAHWCPDCKSMAGTLADLESTYRSRGLLVVGPTQRYGYVKAGRSAPPDEELNHIEEVRKQYYGSIANMAVPVSNDDFLRYGVSTTPTVVLVNADGIVTMYHPGRMTRAELEPVVRKTLEPAAIPGQ